MPDRDWIANLLSYEAEATLKSITQSMEGPRSAREATEFHRLQKVLKAKAESTYEPGLRRQRSATTALLAGLR